MFVVVGDVITENVIAGRPGDVTEKDEEGAAGGGTLLRVELRERERERKNII